MKIAAHGNAGCDAQRTDTREKTPPQRFWWTEQPLGSSDVDHAEKSAVLAAILDTRREPARAFEKSRLRRGLFAPRTPQCRYVGESVNLHLRHGTRYA